MRTFEQIYQLNEVINNKKVYRTIYGEYKKGFKTPGFYIYTAPTKDLAIKFIDGTFRMPNARVEKDATILTYNFNPNDFYNVSNKEANSLKNAIEEDPTFRKKIISLGKIGYKFVNPQGGTEYAILKKYEPEPIKIEKVNSTKLQQTRWDKENKILNDKKAAGYTHKFEIGDRVIHKKCKFTGTVIKCGKPEWNKWGNDEWDANYTVKYDKPQKDYWGDPETSSTYGGCALKKIDH